MMMRRTLDGSIERRRAESTLPSAGKTVGHDHGHQTSISLEPLFWDMLKAAAAERDQAVNALVAEIDAERIRAPRRRGWRVRLGFGW